ncbi:LNS2 domain-containing protein [Streptomyces avicenniae]|uniref:phosphatase domain-containing protein n=1 Tax=Streptomyces avicenniae TaxID=500153 RepID=UPI003B82E5AE
MARWSGVGGADAEAGADGEEDPEDQPPDPRPLAVFDLDGTLADVRHRLHHLTSRRKNWDAFFRAAEHDKPLAEGVALVRKHAATDEIAYVTGRPEHLRADTERWLARHGLPPGRLLMRRAGDRRPARVAKPELLRDLTWGRAVSVVVDDDRQVCRAYRDAGFPVRVADWSDAPEPVLTEAQEREGRT